MKKYPSHFFDFVKGGRMLRVPLNRIGKLTIIRCLIVTIDLIRMATVIATEINITNPLKGHVTVLMLQI